MFKDTFHNQYEQVNMSNYQEFFKNFDKITQVGNTFVRPTIKQNQPGYVSPEHVKRLNVYKHFNIKISFNI